MQRSGGTGANRFDKGYFLHVPTNIEPPAHKKIAARTFVSVCSGLGGRWMCALGMVACSFLLQTCMQGEMMDHEARHGRQGKGNSNSASLRGVTHGQGGNAGNIRQSLSSVNVTESKEHPPHPQAPSVHTDARALLDRCEKGQALLRKRLAFSADVPTCYQTRRLAAVHLGWALNMRRWRGPHSLVMFNRVTSHLPSRSTLNRS
jgi:hypothetical protein